MTFPDAFKAHVIPRIRRMITHQAARVHEGEATFGEACDAIMRRAISVGASYLPDGLFLDLTDYVLATLATDIEAWDAIADQNAREEAADPVGYYTRLAGDDAALQRTFAAISPEYRRSVYPAFRPELRRAHG